MQKINDFIAAIADNASLLQQLTSAGSKAEFLQIAESHGFNLTDQDITLLINLATAQEKQQAGQPLSDEELELVSGGIFGGIGDLIIRVGHGFIGLSNVLKGQFTNQRAV